MTRRKKVAVELWLALAAWKHGVALSNPRITAMRADALLYVSDGMRPREAVRSAEVHAFHLHAVEGCPARRRVVRHPANRG
ncbi:MAG TPA: hypothetical protein VMK42_15000 [Anaeromyxobacteraceae bacterium]|nr:hypothetical protein [Anaeromyxobacteraceae bacterium]